MGLRANGGMKNRFRRRVPLRWLVSICRVAGRTASVPSSLGTGRAAQGFEEKSRGLIRGCREVWYNTGEFQVEKR